MIDWSTHYARRAAGMAGSDVSELLALLSRPNVVSFAGGIPDPSLFPDEALRAAYDFVLSHPKRAATALQYSVPEGDPDLRAWIAEDMSRRGVRCAIENVLITSGSQQALDFLGKLFVSPGETILTGRPTFLGALQAFNAYEPRYEELPGPNSNRGAVSYASAGPDKPKFGYVMPEFENPTGRTLSEAERETLLDFADALDIPLIEDSPYETLRYEGVASPALLAGRRSRARRERRPGDLSRHVLQVDRARSPYWLGGRTGLSDREAGAHQAGKRHSSLDDQSKGHAARRADSRAGPGGARMFLLSRAARRDVASAGGSDAGRRRVDEAGWRIFRLGDLAFRVRRGRVAETRDRRSSGCLRSRCRVLSRSQRREHCASVFPSTSPPQRWRASAAWRR
jgi:hypothetical protein